MYVSRCVCVKWCDILRWLMAHWLIGRKGRQPEGARAPGHARADFVHLELGVVTSR